MRGSSSSVSAHCDQIRMETKFLMKYQWIESLVLTNESVNKSNLNSTKYLQTDFMSFFVILLSSKLLIVEKSNVNCLNIQLFNVLFYEKILWLDANTVLMYLNVYKTELN